MLYLSIRASTLIVFIYNIPLGLILFAYLLFSALLVRRWPLDLIIFIIAVILSVPHFNFSFLISEPYFSFNYYRQHGFIALLQYQLDHLPLIYTHGFISLTLLALALRNITNFYIWRTIQSISIPDSHRALPKGGDTTLLGYSGQIPITISDSELNQHCLIVGTTGSGKTTTILNFVASAIQRNLPVIYLDGKGSTDLIVKIQNLTQASGRIFKVFTLRPQSSLANLAGYNPFGSGTPTEWKNRIMSLFAQVEGKGQEHFSLGEQNYINFVANILAKLNRPVDLRVILAFLENPDKLLATAHTIDGEIGHKLAKLHNDNNLQPLIGDVVKLLELFIYSDYGGLFNTLDMDNVIKIKQGIQNNEVILFLFDASSYPEDTQKVAKMVINDINSSFSDLGTFTPCFCVFDEFASYASSNLAETISLHRSNGMHAIIGTQSITTVKLKSLETRRIAEELLACCNTYIAHRINHSTDAEELAKVMGVRSSYDITMSKSSNEVGGNILSKSIKTSEEFRIHPQIFKDLAPGHAVIYRKATGKPPVKVQIGVTTQPTSSLDASYAKSRNNNPEKLS